MIEDIENLKTEFKKIKDKGWIKSERKDFGGVGITFEKLVGITANELEIPDFGQIEIKTKTTGSDPFITLFNCVPTGPHYHEIERIKELYGYSDGVLKDKKVLNLDIYCNKLTKGLSNFYFNMSIDSINKKLLLIVQDRFKKVIENDVYWDFDILEEKLYRKLKCLAIVNAQRKIVNSEKWFKYYEMKIYRLKDFETFLKLIEKGIIRVCFKIGVFRSGNKIGKIHDRGTSFCIEEKNIKLLYDVIDSAI